MSMRTIACSSSNRNSASVLASSVLPTPVGPRNRNEPIGRFGSESPDRLRRIALATADLADRLLLGFPVRLHAGRLLAQPGELGVERVEPLAAGFVGLLGEGHALDLELADAALDDVDLGGHRVDLDAQPAGGLVDQVD